jgi:hypothetical protein
MELSDERTPPKPATQTLMALWPLVFRFCGSVEFGTVPKFQRALLQLVVPAKTMAV